MPRNRLEHPLVVGILRKRSCGAKHLQMLARGAARGHGERRRSLSPEQSFVCQGHGFEMKQFHSDTISFLETPHSVPVCMQRMQEEA